jgi:hypothetical protein
MRPIREAVRNNEWDTFLGDVQANLDAWWDSTAVPGTEWENLLHAVRTALEAWCDRVDHR